jgi:hypothetical protein
MRLRPRPCELQRIAIRRVIRKPEEHIPELAARIARALTGNEPPEAVATDVSAFRRRFDRLHFIRN